MTEREAPVPGADIPLADAWNPEEWQQVRANRTLLDRLLRNAPARILEHRLAGRLAAVHEKLPCFGIIAGIYLYLETTAGGMIQAVGSSPAERRSILALLNRALRSGQIANLPQEDGLWECIGGLWQRSWAFRNHDPSALVCDRLLLADPVHWAVCEAHERAHAIGLTEADAVAVEAAAARLLMDCYPEGDEHQAALALLAKSEARARERSR